MSNQENLNQFQLITGSSKEKANTYLQQANWNLEQAVSSFLDAGEQPDPIIVEQNLLIPPPPPVVQEESDDILGILPGLYASGSNSLIPLREIHVKAKIVHFIADVELTQYFVNDHDQSIEAIFKFEHHNAILTNFQVEINGKIYQGQCKSKEEAENTYDDAIAGSHGAYMVEQAKKENLFKILMGNIPPKQTCKLILRYVMELDVDNEYLKFILPITRCPIQKLEDNSSVFTVNLEISMPSKITEIQSPSHTILPKMTDDENVSITLDSSQLCLGIEFELRIKLEEPYRPLALVEEENVVLEDVRTQPGTFFNLPAFPQPFDQSNLSITTTTTTTTTTETTTATTTESFLPKKDGLKEPSRAIMLSLYPKIETDEDTITEIIFLVDCSGSMSGTRINQAKNALQLFLRSLPFGTHFNIVQFGSHHSQLFSSSQLFDQSSLKRATEHVSSIQANMGGTEILAPLTKIMSQLIDPNFPRQIFCLTDGEVNNTQEVLDYIKSNIGNYTRIFTFGIGAEASKALVRGIAKYGKGKAEFVVSGERIEGKVIKQLKYALQPILKNVSVHWGDLPLEEKYSYIQPKYPSLFNGDRLVIYAFIDKTKKIPIKSLVTVSGNTGEKKFSWEVLVDMEKDIIKGSHVHRLTAHQLVRFLDQEPNNIHKPQIIELGIQWGLVTKFTSYVITEERFEEAVSSEMKKVVVGKEIQYSLEERMRNFEVEEKIKQINSILDRDLIIRSSLVEQSDQINFLEEKSDVMMARTYKKMGSFNFVGAISRGIQSAVEEVGSAFSNLFTSNTTSNICNNPLYNDSMNENISSIYRRNRENSIPMEKAINNTQMRPLDLFILLQDADGSFILSEEFCKLTGILMDKIQNTIPEFQIVPEYEGNVSNITIWTTAIALSFLEKKFHDLKDEWLLLGEKATKYLKRHVSNGLQELLLQADTLL